MKCLNCNSKKLLYVNNDDIKDSYTCLNCNYIFPKQYFFVSHSHLDIEKVRVIRNTIEETFFYEPILFFLKSLSEEKEIKDLLKREIYERIWFVYCNSENAQNSEYVQFERKYVNELIEKGIVKHVINIELDKFNTWDEECINYLKNQINHHIKKGKLFFSFSRSTYQYIGPVIKGLKNLGYSIFDINSLSGGDVFFTSIQEQIKNVSYNDGVFIQVIQGEISKISELEVEVAKNNGAYVLRIVISDKTNLDEPNTIYINKEKLSDAEYIINVINNYLIKM
jgi:hypothetical protein